MKRWIFFALSLSCTAWGSSWHDMEDSLIFLSPGVSGTHLTMLNVYVATKRPVHLIKPRQNVKRYNPLKLQFAAGAKPYYHTHNPPHLRYIDTRSNRLILVIRNYKDWLLRRYIALLSKRSITVPNPMPKETCKRIYAQQGGIKSYYYYLTVFDQWPEERRLLLFYEDLTKQPLESFKKIQQFLGVESQNLEEDMALLAELNSKSKQYYNSGLARFGGTRSEGKGSSAYTMNLSKADLRDVDKKVQHINPKLFGKYLMRYLEK